MVNRENLFKDYPESVTVKQLMQMLNIGRSTAYELVSTKQVDSFRIGKNNIRITKESIIRYVTKNFV